MTTLRFRFKTDPDNPGQLLLISDIDHEADATEEEKKAAKMVQVMVVQKSAPAQSGPMLSGAEAHKRAKELGAEMWPDPKTDQPPLTAMKGKLEC